ncbi:MAG: DUF86 domain-containing protein [Tunicatimonas sp.]
MSKRDLALLLEDMLVAAHKIQKYTAAMAYDDFIADDKTVDAVVRNFEIIGEAANRVDPDYRLNNPAIEWKRIRGFRNRIVHDYFGIDYRIVWSIVENDIDELIFQLKLLLEEQ